MACFSAHTYNLVQGDLTLGNTADENQIALTELNGKSMLLRAGCQVWDQHEKRLTMKTIWNFKLEVRLGRGQRERDGLGEEHALAQSLKAYCSDLASHKSCINLAKLSRLLSQCFHRPHADIDTKAAAGQSIFDRHVPVWLGCIPNPEKSSPHRFRLGGEMLCE